MQQAVDAAEIDEGAVIRDVLHHARQHLALAQRGDQLGARLGAALFHDGAARDHDIAAGAIHLQDLERLGRAHERADIAHRADVHLAAGQEGHGAGEVDGEAALDAPEDDAGHALIVLEGLLELGPGFLAPGLLARQNGFAVLVFHALEIDFDGVAHLELGLLAGGGEFLELDAALGLQSDVDEGEIILDGDDDALEHAAFESVAGADRFLEQRGETVLAIFGGGGLSRGGFGHVGSFSLCYSGRPVVSGGLDSRLRDRPLTAVREGISPGRGPAGYARYRRAPGRRPDRHRALSCR